MKRYVLIFCLFLFLLPAARAQSANVPSGATVANEEDVRRIVERAMAAVALAEAQTNRSIAEMQIRLNERQVELERIRGENGTLRLAAQQGRSTEETNSAQVESLKAELARAQSMLEDAQSALKAWQARSETLSDSLLQLSAILQKTTTEKSELIERLDAVQTRASLLEESLRAASSRAEEMATNREGVKQIEGAMSASVADSMASIVAEREHFEAMTEELREKNRTLQSRSRVIEDALREQTSLADTANMSRLAEVKVYADSLAQAMAELRAVSVERNNLQARTGPLEQKNVELEDARVRLDAALAASKVEKANGEAELSSVRRQGEILTARLDAMQSERDSLANELMANRREITNAMRAVNDNSAAIRTLRAERDAAIALARAREMTSVTSAVEDPRLAEAMRKNVEYELELASLRRLFAASLAVESSWSGSSVSAVSVQGSRPSGSLAVEPSLTGSSGWTGSSGVVDIPREPIMSSPPISVPVVGVGTIPSLDLNTASYDALSTVVEIGPTRARAIVWYRENIGPIKNEDDLKSVPGFNDERIRSLKALWRP